MVLGGTNEGSNPNNDSTFRIDKCNIQWYLLEPLDHWEMCWLLETWSNGVDQLKR